MIRRNCLSSPRRYLPVWFGHTRRQEGFSDWSKYIFVKEILPAAEDAERETTRLNELNEPKGSLYFWDAAHFLRTGRRAKPGSDADPSS